MKKLTLENLLFMENQCINPQDAIVIRLLIERVEMHHIVYLKKTSIDVVNKLVTIKNYFTGERKQHPISQHCIDLYYNAIKQTQYILNNGGDPSEQIIPLQDSDYIIKASVNDYAAHKNQEMDSVILQTIYTRFFHLAKLYLFPEIAYLTTIKLDISTWANA